MHVCLRCEICVSLRVQSRPCLRRAPCINNKVLEATRHVFVAGPSRACACVKIWRFMSVVNSFVPCSVGWICETYRVELDRRCLILRVDGTFVHCNISLLLGKVLLELTLRASLLTWRHSRLRGGCRRTLQAKLHQQEVKALETKYQKLDFDYHQLMNETQSDIQK